MERMAEARRGLTTVAEGPLPELTGGRSYPLPFGPEVAWSRGPWSASF